jgi:hypothetical protein
VNFGSDAVDCFWVCGVDVLGDELIAPCDRFAGSGALVEDIDLLERKSLGLFKE